MRELTRTNDPVVISVIEGLLREEGIVYHVMDRNMSILEGSLNLIQIRILVPDDQESAARDLLVDADLGHWLRP